MEVNLRAFNLTENVRDNHYFSPVHYKLGSRLFRRERAVQINCILLLIIQFLDYTTRLQEQTKNSYNKTVTSIMI